MVFDPDTCPARKNISKYIGLWLIEFDWNWAIKAILAPLPADRQQTAGASTPEIATATAVMIEMTALTESRDRHLVEVGMDIETVIMRDIDHRDMRAGATVAVAAPAVVTDTLVKRVGK
jgi:hypothetical protein